MSIQVISPQESWTDAFERERRLLERLLAPWIVPPAEHIGSTAVPGLAAKPIIDMMAGVEVLDDARAAVEPLAGRGYVYAEHRPDALYFYRDIEGDEPGFHLHLTEPRSPLWQERLAFRNALRASPTLVNRYQSLKMELSAQYPADLRAYTGGKRAFVIEVLASVGVILQPR